MPTLPPVLDFRAPTVTDEDAAALAPGDTHEQARYTGDLAGVDLSGSTFLECEFDALALGDAQLRGSRFAEMLITASFATSLLAARTTWREVRIESPRWGLAELYDSDVTSLHIVGGKIDYLNLRDARLSNVLIEGCQIGELDLRRSRLTRVALRDCRVGTVEFDRVVAKDVDIRGSQFSVVNGLDGMRGVTIDAAQLDLFAPLFAGQLGVLVE